MTAERRHQGSPLEVRLTDSFWAPRVEQLNNRTLGVIWERLENQGVVDNFRRLVGRAAGPRRALHFSDSDLYKWVEAATLAGGAEGLEETIALIEAVQLPDGYVGTYYGIDDHPARYSDLRFGHEQYCIGHLIEAAVSHHAVSQRRDLLDVAVRAADHLLATFGPGRDERCDAHPEIEIALCRLAEATGASRYVDHAAWVIDRQLENAGTDLDSFRPGGHAVRALYLTSGIAEVALATGDDRWTRAARRLDEQFLRHHSYPTGAVGGRWLGEAVGRPEELPDAAAYAESCAAVAAAQLAWRMWRLDRDPRALDQLELLLFNAVPCGVGADGSSWFYSQPQAVDAVAAEIDPWSYEFDYGQLMMREWFPVHRHEWFDVPCCPPNLARMFATVPDRIAQTAGNDLLVHLPLACSITGEGWDLCIEGGYPFEGDVRIVIDQQPPDGRVLIRRPGWAGGSGHEPLGANGVITLPVEPAWWTTDHRVEGGTTVHVRGGPIVYCTEGVDHPGVDLRDLVADPSASSPPGGFGHCSPSVTLHQPWTGSPAATWSGAEITLTPYAAWGNRGETTMRTRFPVVLQPEDSDTRR
jgi:DUF1680 family protein